MKKNLGFLFATFLIAFSLFLVVGSAYPAQAMTLSEFIETYLTKQQNPQPTSEQPTGEPTKAPGDVPANADLLREPTYDCAGKYAGNPDRIRECNALVDLYVSTRGENWTNRTGWLSSADYCTWFNNGFMCGGSGDGRRVNRLNLPNNNLSGSIPNSISNLSGLYTLRLDRNRLSGSIPNSIGSLGRLTDLLLYDNQLSGSVPTSMGSLPLENLLLGTNQLSGSIPASFSNLSRLRDFRVDYNSLSGEFPSGLVSHTNYSNLYFNHQRNAQGQISDTQICVSSQTRTALATIVSSGGNVRPHPDIPPTCSTSPTPTGAVVPTDTPAPIPTDTPAPIATDTPAPIELTLTEWKTGYFGYITLGTFPGTRFDINQDDGVNWADYEVLRRRQ